MKNKKFFETVKSNKKGKKTALILVLAASLFAMAAALFGFFRSRKSRRSGSDQLDTVDADKHIQKRSDHAESVPEHEAERTQIADSQSAVVSQQVPVVRPLPEKRPVSWAKRFRKHLSAAMAVILVISLVGSGTMSYVQPAMAMAKESFSGISKIVSERAESSEPYRILDIVPAYAVYDGYRFSTGTMGYLTGGQAPIVNDLTDFLRNNYGYSSYGARKNLIESVLSDGSLYIEHYGGVHSVDGWTKLFDADTEGNSTTGRFYGKYTWVGGGNGDFKAPFEIELDNAGNYLSAGVNGAYYLNPYNGSYHVSFVAAEGGAYKISEIHDLSDFADAPNTWVYSVDEFGNYVFSGLTVSDALALQGTSGEGDATDENDKDKDDKDKDKDKDKDDKDKDDTDKKDEEDSGDDETGDGSDDGTGENGDETGSDDGSGDGGENGDGTGSDDGSGDGGENGDGTGTGGETGDGNGDVTGDVNNGEGNGTDSGNGEGENNVGSGDGIGNGETGGNANNDNGDDDATSGETGGDVNNDGNNNNGGGNVNNDGSNNSGGDDVNIGVNDNGDDATSGGNDAVNNGVDGETGTISINSNMADNTLVLGQWRKLAEDNDISDDNAGGNNAGSYVVLTFEYNLDEQTDGTLYNIADVVPKEEGEIAYDLYDQIAGADEAVSDPEVEARAVPDETNELGVFQYVGEGNGDCKLEPLNASSYDGADGEVGWIDVTGVSVYFKCNVGSDWLERYVFGTVSGGINESNGFKIEVITKRADEVESGMIQGVDMIYLESGSGNTVLNGDLNAYIGTSTDSETGADMGADAVSAILYHATTDLLPVIVDYDASRDTHYQNTNYQRLAQSLLKEDLTKFYITMNQNGNLLDNIAMNVTALEFPDKGDNSNHYVNQNIYVINDSIMSEGFFDAELTAGFAEVLAAIRAENTLLSDENKISEKVTRAKAIQYIINLSVGIVGELGDLVILELQPTANEKPDLELDSTSNEDGYTNLYLKTDYMSSAQQILSSRKGFSIYPSVKSVAEFNGELEDINSTYDLIFIGLDGQKLYRDNDENRTALYNDSFLNGKVYHKGDDSGAGRYDANDITAQKMSDLLEYLHAGYPVLVEDAFFVDGTAQNVDAEAINKKYVAEDTAMYAFLAAAVKYDDYKQSIFTVKDTKLYRTFFMAQVTIDRPRIRVVTEDGETAPKKQIVSPDPNSGDYHFTINYAITGNKGDTYNPETRLRLYFDYNYDGIFAAEEEVTGYNDPEGSLVVNFNGGSDGVPYNGSIEVIVREMASGLLPWKLEVSDVGNSFRRDSEQGYFELNSSTESELKVLQITEQTGNNNVNLQTMYDNRDNFQLGNSLYSAGQLTNNKLIIETVNANSLVAATAEMLMEAADVADETGNVAVGSDDILKYLEQWDVVVVTLDGGRSADGGELGMVMAAVESYAAAGRSLLVCAQGQGDDVTSGSDTLGLSAGLLGLSESQDQNRTYTALGSVSPKDKLRYSGLDREMFGVQSSLRAESINEGSILYYPNQLGSTINLGGSFRAPTYLLDFENNLLSETSETGEAYVTAWYTFGSSSDGSPFKVSPKDARNNYYCYSKGNVFYLAQSEYWYPYTIEEDGEGKAECRLFVNALMAAYNAGLHNAEVHIVSGFAWGSADVDSIAVPFDEDWRPTTTDEEGTLVYLNQGGMLDNTVYVYFRFRDDNAAKSKDIKIRFLRQDPTVPDGAEVDIGGRKVKATMFDSEIWTVTDDGKPARVGEFRNGELQLVGGYRLMPDTTYRIEAPVITLEGDSTKNKADIYVVIDTYMKGGQAPDIISSDIVSLTRAQLFLLE